MTDLEKKDVMVNERILNLVRQLLKDNINNCKISVESASKLGENWLGLLNSLTIEYENIDKNKIKLYLVAKVAPHQTAYRDALQIREVYIREIFFYNSVIPEFRKLQEERRLPQIFNPFPKLYATTTEEFREGVLMADMKKKGFRVYNHRVNTDYPHTLMAIKELGKFHALSYALKAHKPEAFKYLLLNCEESFFKGLHDSLVSIVTKLGNIVLKAYDQVEDKEHYDALRNSINGVSNTLKFVFSLKNHEEYAVINHGDYEVRNILYKYEDSTQPTVPTELCMLDWQLSRAGSPALDILMFIFVCTDKEFRDRHYLDLIHEYYHSFSSLLGQLGCNPDSFLPFSVLLDHLKQFAPYGLYMAIWVNSLNMKQSHDIPDVYNSSTMDAVIEEMCSTSNDEYIKKIHDVVAEFIKYGYNFKIAI
ncbi:hypothetical protein RI129_008580 [Pyrocoelia pectoralis]|uniref:CHK kinase-like domain-containing protein n=1 Tax=Pyrocoelia pectoralis TaxID=417401 RepID=A0AAN7ZKA0_9COLE